MKKYLLLFLLIPSTCFAITTGTVKSLGLLDPRAGINWNDFPSTVPAGTSINWADLYNMPTQTVNWNGSTLTGASGTNWTSLSIGNAGANWTDLLINGTVSLNSGNNNMAIGLPPQVQVGQYSIELQNNRTANTQVATGTYSVDLGNQNTCAGNNAVGGDANTCIGLGNTVGVAASNQQDNVGIGYGNTVTGVNADAIGSSNTVTSSSGGSVAIGLSNTVTGSTGSMAIGSSNIVTDQYGTAVGGGVYTTGQVGTTVGSNVTNDVPNSVGLGTGFTLGILANASLMIDELPNTYFANYASLGSELVNNPTFTGTCTPWTFGTKWTCLNPGINRGTTGTSTALSEDTSSFNTPLVVGQMYLLTVTVSAFTASTSTSNNIAVTVGGASSSNYIDKLTIFNTLIVGQGTHKRLFMASTPATALTVTIGGISGITNLTLTNVSIKPVVGGNVIVGGQINSQAAQTVVNCSTSGTVTFSEPLSAAFPSSTTSSITKVMACEAACLGTASYTFPYAFTNTPYALGTIAAGFTSISTTATTVTGATTTGCGTLEGF